MCSPFTVTCCCPDTTASVTVDESVREDERSNDEEKDENVESDICQLFVKTGCNGPYLDAT